MTEHRDSPGMEPGGVDEARPPGFRRLARLVDSPAARRVALPRLLVATGILLGLVILIGVVGSRMVARYVASGADYRISLDEIELVPEPGPWIRDGRSRILEQVRLDSKRPGAFSLLDFDPETLRTDFRRCPWIKGVVRIESSFRRLTIHVTYRKPVAVVLHEGMPPVAYPVDEEGVYLPVSDIDWIASKSPFLPRGLVGPLIEIRGVESSRPPRAGTRWKRPEPGRHADEEVDQMVLGAARLAEFLQRQARSTPGGRLAPAFVAIHVPPPGHSYFIADEGKNLVSWGKTPGDESPGGPPAEARWKMLLGWVDVHGPLDAKYPRFLQFGQSGATVSVLGTEK